MTKLIHITMLIFALGLTTLYAESTHNNAHGEEGHKGHKHSPIYDKVKPGLSKEDIENAAIQKVQTLVAEKKIHKSWQNAPISKIGKTHYGDTDDWVVGFENMKMKNKERRTLYIFVSIYGDIRGANYSGN